MERSIINDSYGLNCRQMFCVFSCSFYSDPIKMVLEKQANMQSKVGTLASLLTVKCISLV